MTEIITKIKKTKNTRLFNHNDKKKVIIEWFLK